MKTDVPKGTKIVLEHCEVLDKEGNYINNIMSVGGIGKGCDQKDVYISSGKKATYIPQFYLSWFPVCESNGYSG